MAAINPKRGDLYWVDWNPSRGSEQAGVRPALIIQNDVANAVVSYPVTIVLAVSTRIKNYPPNVLINPSTENGLAQPSEVLTGQILTIAKQRLQGFIGHISDADMQHVKEKLAYMLDLT